jgi:hypothetical protein
MANPILTNALGSSQSLYKELGVSHVDQKQNVVGSHRVGTRGQLPDGRVFYYATNGATALTAGTALIVVATTGLNIAATDDKVILTASFANFKAGAQRGIVLSEADKDTADLVDGAYAEGYMYFEQVAPEGQYYKIESHDAIDASGTATNKTINLYDPLLTAASATTQISFAKNPYSRVVTSSTAQNETVIGVSPIPVTESGAAPTDVTASENTISTYCFWAQTWGPCNIEVGSTGVIPGVAVTSDGTADRLDIVATTGHTSNSTTLGGVESPHVGWGLVSAAAAAGDFVLVDLRCRP